MEKIQYMTAIERKAIISEKVLAGLYLIEVLNHADGQFLVFDTEPKSDSPPNEKETLESLAVKVEALKVDLTQLREKVK